MKKLLKSAQEIAGAAKFRTHAITACLLVFLDDAQSKL